VRGSPPAASAPQVRELRRSDRDSFLEALGGAYGPFEALLGLDSQDTEEMAGLFRPGVWFALRFLRVFGRAPVRVVVAASGSRVVGTTMVLTWPRAGYILGVGVRPEFRRRGLAGQLVGWGEEVARRRGKSWAVLDVEAENTAAVALYRRRGYETVDRTVWLWRTPPATPSARAGSSRVGHKIGTGEQRAASEWVARHSPEALSRTVYPLDSRLTHLEILALAPQTTREVWVAGTPQAPGAFVVACTRGSRMPGILFLPCVDPGMPAAELVEFAAGAADGLLAQGSPSVLAAIPSAAATALPHLLAAGYTEALATLTMVRPLRGAPGPTGAPKAV
jgi:GNAT superfamily N-acetyltransferase